MTESTARDLIQRLADELDHCRQLLADDRRVVHPLAAKARTYLAAQAEPVFTAEEVEMIAAPWSYLQPSLPTPIPLSERLPGPEDCDAKGRCWVFDQGDAVTEPAWNLTSVADLQDLRQMESEGTLIGLCERWRLAWLPRHALPLPDAP